MSRLFLSSYDDTDRLQFKGNLHTHTTESDGPYSPQDTVRAYAGRGYDFLMLSDHDAVTETERLDPCGMTLIPGNEITLNGAHLLHVNANAVIEPDPERQAIIDNINGQGGFAIMNHPNWGENFVHCSQAELEMLRNYDGIEIYNGVSERVEGNAMATDRWDMLLSKGRRVWGFGNDDCHEPWDFEIAWNAVFAEDQCAESLIAAMREGRFYVSTGVHIDAIHADEHCLTVESKDTQCFRIVCDHGRVLDTVVGARLEFVPPYQAPFSYFRIECYGFGTRMAWTQPCFIAQTQ